MIKRNHFSKLTPEIANYIKENCSNKYAAAEGSSSRQMARKIFQIFNVKVSSRTVNNWLNKLVGFPRRPKNYVFIKKER